MKIITLVSNCTSEPYPSSSIIWNVLLESFAIATQLRAKMPYGAENMKKIPCIRMV
jgi:hypothetical protein